MLAALFENVTGSVNLQQDEETLFVRPSASSSLGFVVLPLHVNIFHVWAWNKESVVSVQVVCNILDEPTTLIK